MPDSATLSLTQGRGELGPASRWLEARLVEMNVPEGTRWDLLLVLEEILVNVVDYAYAGRSGSVEIRVDRDANLLQLTVADRGRAFDPLSAAPPDLDLPIAQRPEGGLGIHLIRSLCDEIAYRREGESNILTVRKRLA